MKIGEIAAILISVIIVFQIEQTEGSPIPSATTTTSSLLSKKWSKLDDRHSENVFEAYWCGDPSKVQNMGFVNTPQCSSQAKVAKTEEVVYQLIHEIKHQKTKGYSCQVSMTRIARYCGVYDHQTVFTPYNQYDAPVSVSMAMCQDWHSRLIYEDSAGKSHPLMEDTVNIVRFEALGNTYVAPGSGEVSCSGQDLRWEGEVIHNVLVEVQVRITLKREEFRIKGGKIKAYYDNVMLPCESQQYYCQTPLTSSRCSPSGDWLPTYSNGD